MNTKIFCDIADLSSIKKFNLKKVVKGFTTNPSLMRKAGAKDYKSYSKKILSICKNKPISLEVFADNQKKMIVTDYQFIPAVLSMNSNSAARIWWRHHIYPEPGSKYYKDWKNFLLTKIKKNNIDVIYTVHPLEGENDIFEGMVDKKCYSTEWLSEILTVQKLKNCNE